MFQKSLNAPGWESFKLPADLVRPPCLPGGEQGKEQACILESVGVYCIPHRIKYKYPPFSETMQAIPGSGKVRRIRALVCKLPDFWESVLWSKSNYLTQKSFVNQICSNLLANFHNLLFKALNQFVK